MKLLVLQNTLLESLIKLCYLTINILVGCEIVICIFRVWVWWWTKCELWTVMWKISWSHFSLFVAQALIYETTFYLQRGEKNLIFMRKQICIWLTLFSLWSALDLLSSLFPFSRFKISKPRSGSEESCGPRQSYLLHTSTIALAFSSAEH